MFRRTSARSRFEMLPAVKLALLTCLLGATGLSAQTATTPAEYLKNYLRQGKSEDGGIPYGSGNVVYPADRLIRDGSARYGSGRSVRAPQLGISGFPWQLVQEAEPPAGPILLRPDASNERTSGSPSGRLADPQSATSPKAAVIVLGPRDSNRDSAAEIPVAARDGATTLVAPTTRPCRVPGG
jgi:hypothetical protein